MLPRSLCPSRSFLIGRGRSRKALWIDGTFMLLPSAAFPTPIHGCRPHARIQEGDRIAHTISLPPEPDESRVKHVFCVGVAGNPLAGKQNQSRSLFAEPSCLIVDLFQIAPQHIDTADHSIGCFRQKHSCQMRQNITSPAKSPQDHRFFENRIVDTYRSQHQGRIPRDARLIYKAPA